MMLEISVVLLSFVGLLLQGSLFDYFSLVGVKPDIVLTCVVFYALFQGAPKGLAMGAVVGLMEDLLMGQMVGPMLILRMLIGGGVGLISRSLYHDRYLSPIILLVLSTLFANAFQWVLYMFQKGAISPGFFLRVSLFQSIYNLLFMPFFYVINYYVVLQEKKLSKEL